MQYYTIEDYIDLVVFLNKNVTSLNEEKEEYKLDKKEGLQKGKGHHKHDKLFKKILNNKKEVAVLINQELKPEKEIKEEDIEKYETKYIIRLYEEKQADIVYKLKNKEVFFLIEHQTKVDRNMPIRIAEYSLAIMNSRRMKNKGKNARIVPIVIYAGMEKWTAKRSLEETQEEFRHRKGSSSIIRYNLVDIRDIKEAIEKGTGVARMSVIERLKTKEEVINAVDQFAENLTSKEEREEFVEEVRYILENRLEEKDLNKIKEIILKEEGDDSMSHVHEVLRRDAERERKKAIAEGLAEGMKEGIKKGRKESLIDVAKKMLKQKFDIEIITEITGLKKEQFMS